MISLHFCSEQFFKVGVFHNDGVLFFQQFRFPEDFPLLEVRLYSYICRVMVETRGVGKTTTVFFRFGYNEPKYSRILILERYWDLENILET